jgi:hypothetical protein
MLVKPKNAINALVVTLFDAAVEVPNTFSDIGTFPQPSYIPVQSAGNDA